MPNCSSAAPRLTPFPPLPATLPVDSYHLNMSMPGSMTMPNVLRGSYSGAGIGDGHDHVVSADLGDAVPGARTGRGALPLCARAWGLFMSMRSGAGV